MSLSSRLSLFSVIALGALSTQGCRWFPESHSSTASEGDKPAPQAPALCDAGKAPSQTWIERMKQVATQAQQVKAELDRVVTPEQQAALLEKGAGFAASQLPPDAQAQLIKSLERAKQLKEQALTVKDQIDKVVTPQQQRAVLDQFNSQLDAALKDRPELQAQVRGTMSTIVRLQAEAQKSMPCMSPKDVDSIIGFLTNVVATNTSPTVSQAALTELARSVVLSKKIGLALGERLKEMGVSDALKNSKTKLDPNYLLVVKLLETINTQMPESDAKLALFQSLGVDLNALKATLPASGVTTAPLSTQPGLAPVGSDVGNGGDASSQPAALPRATQGMQPAPDAVPTQRR